MALGNISVSSLIHSAQSAQTQLQGIEDQKQAFAWEFGPQDAAAHSNYSGYIGKRIAQLNAGGTISDTSKAISFQKLGMTTDRQFRTAQIHDATLNVLNGNMSDEEKAGRLKTLAMQAYGEGDTQNGMSIESMYDRAIISIQTKQQALQTAAAAGVSQAQTALNKTYQQQENILKQDSTTALTDFSKGKIDANTYYNRVSQNYSALNNMYSSLGQDASIGDTHTQAWLDKGNSLQNDENFQKFTNPDIIAQLKSGAKPFSVEFDKVGKASLKWNDQVGQSVIMGPDGKPILKGAFTENSPNIKKVVDQVKSSGQGDLTIDHNGVGIHQQVFAELDPTTGLPDLQGGHGYYYFDKTTGHKIDVNFDTNGNTVQHVLAQPGQPNAFARGGQFKPTLEQAAANGEPVAGTLQNINKIGSAIGNGVDTAIGAVAGQVGEAVGKTAKAVGDIPSNAAYTLLHPMDVVSALVHRAAQSPFSSHNDLVDRVNGFIGGGMANPVSSLIGWASGVQSAKAKAAAIEQAAAQARQEQAVAQQAAQTHLAQLQAKQAAVAPSPVFKAYNPSLAPTPPKNFLPDRPISAQLPYPNASNNQETAANIGVAAYGPAGLPKL